jgi:hypothetical protein
LDIEDRRKVPTPSKPDVDHSASDVNFVKRSCFADPLPSALGNGIATQSKLIGEESVSAATLAGIESIELQSTKFRPQNHWSVLFVGEVVV